MNRVKAYQYALTRAERAIRRARIAFSVSLAFNLVFITIIIQEVTNV